jgi:hypothetical protein
MLSKVWMCECKRSQALPYCPSYPSLTGSSIYSVLIKVELSKRHPPRARGLLAYSNHLQLLPYILHLPPPEHPPPCRCSQCNTWCSNQGRWSCKMLTRSRLQRCACASPNERVIVLGTGSRCSLLGSIPSCRGLVCPVHTRTRTRMHTRTRTHTHTRACD